MLKYLKYSIFFGLVLIAFQNCAPSTVNQFEDKSLSAALDYFGLSFTKPMPVYFEAQTILESQDATNNNYKFILFAGNSTPTDSFIEYQLKILDSADNSLCTIRSGSFENGNSMIIESCAILKTKKLAKTIYQVRKNSGEWNETVQIY